MGGFLKNLLRKPQNTSFIAFSTVLICFTQCIAMCNLLTFMCNFPPCYHLYTRADKGTSDLGLFRVSNTFKKFSRLKFTNFGGVKFICFMEHFLKEMFYPFKLSKSPYLNSRNDQGFLQFWAFFGLPFSKYTPKAEKLKTFWRADF